MCRHCGTVLFEPPVPVAPIGATAAPAPHAPAAAPRGDDRFFAPTVLEPVTVTAPAPPRRHGPIIAVVIVIAVVALGAGAYALFGGHGSGTASVPVAMPPHGPANGMPGGLSDVVRIQAESSRQIALAAIAQATSESNGAPLDVRYLAQVAPSLTWRVGTDSSTGSHDVSLTQGGTVTTIAIAASNKEICAYAHFQAGQPSQYVTMLNDKSCKAVDAPSDGWSPLPGGSSADLPPEGY